MYSADFKAKTGVVPTTAVFLHNLARLRRHPLSRWNGQAGSSQKLSKLPFV
jgi:hypothetical protein